MRVLGMKFVALLSLLQALNEELSVLGKLGKVFNISYGHMARFDRRFKVRFTGGKGGLRSLGLWGARG